jgi:hypothetical protein
MLKFILATLVIMVVLFGWVLVQHMARLFAKRHPEFGPYVEKGGCGGKCSCASGGSCKSR